MYIRVCARWRVPYYIIYIRRGLWCCCLLQRQYQSLRMRNSKIAVPLFLLCLLIFDILDYRKKVESLKKKDKRLAYVRKKLYLCSKF